MDTWDNIIIILCIVSAAGFIQGTTGFGFGLIALSLISLIIDVKDAAILLAPAGLCLNIILFIRLLKFFKPKDVITLIIACLSGVPFGIWFLIKTDKHLVMNVLGILLVVAVTIRITSATKDKLTEYAKCAEIPCGLLGGALAGAFGTGGPPLIIYLASRKFEHNRYIVCVQAVLGTAALLRNLIFLWNGNLSVSITMQSCIGGIAAGIFAIVGVKVAQYIPVKIMDNLISFMLLCIAVKYLFF